MTKVSPAPTTVSGVDASQADRRGLARVICRYAHGVVPAPLISNAEMVSPKRVAMAGVPISANTQTEVVSSLVRAALDGRGGWVVPVNLDVHRQLVRGGPAASTVIGEATLVADGMPIIWAAAISGYRISERVCGSDLLPLVTSEALESGLSVMFAGGANDSARKAAASFGAQQAGLARVASSDLRVSDVPTPSQVDELSRHIKSSKASVVFVGMGFPKQELLIEALRRQNPQVVFVSCGAAIDMRAGLTSRGPTLAHRLGFEWLVRLAQEPRRLAPRYLYRGVPYGVKLLLGALRSRGNRVLRGFDSEGWGLP